MRSVIRSLALVSALVIAAPLATTSLAAPAQNSQQSATVNVNTASASQLAAALPGIGAAKAAAIIQYRKENGKFTSTDQLVNVPGIGEKTLARIRAMVAI